MSWWIRTLLVLPVLGLVSFAGPSLSPRGSHLWDLTEVFSNADGTIQFIELQECCGGNMEILLPTLSITSDAHILALPGGLLDPPTANRHYLVATQGFANLPGAPTPDAIIPAHMAPFFSINGDTVNYVPYDTWKFASVPTDGVNSLRRDGAIGVNTPTNFAGETGTVDAGLFGVPYCSGFVCPCGNHAGPGAGCLNSTGSGARVSVAAGSTSIAADDLVLSITGHAPLNSSLVYMGSNIVFGSAVADGLSCTNSLFRFLPFQMDTVGRGQLANIVASAPPGMIQPGDSRTFQSWARDVLCGPPPSPCPSPCGNNSNISSGIQIVFAP